MTDMQSSVTEGGGNPATEATDVVLRKTKHGSAGEPSPEGAIKGSNDDISGEKGEDVPSCDAQPERALMQGEKDLPCHSQAAQPERDNRDLQADLIDAHQETSNRLFREAADKLAALRAENERLEGEFNIAATTGEWPWEAERDGLIAKCERLQRIHDEATELHANELMDFAAKYDELAGDFVRARRWRDYARRVRRQRERFRAKCERLTAEKDDLDAALTLSKACVDAAKQDIRRFGAQRDAARQESERLRRALGECDA